MTTCAIWCRVSKTEQETANQEAELRGWAACKGLEITREYVFEVSASNGNALHKETLNRAMADARLGHFDVLLVWALDRLTREGVEATLSLLRRFAGHGVAVWSRQESWTETADPRMAELLASLYGWMAAEESRRRSERTKAGLARRKNEGKPVGRQPGAKDKTPRRRSGYIARWESERGSSTG